MASVNEMHDTFGIPDEAAHWDALASRVSQAALRSHSALDWVGRRSTGWLGLIAVACAASLSLALLPLTQTRSKAREDFALAFAPLNRLGRSVIAPDAPPALLALLLDQGPVAGRKP